MPAREKRQHHRELTSTTNTLIGEICFSSPSPTFLYSDTCVGLCFSGMLGICAVDPCTLGPAPAPAEPSNRSDMELADALALLLVEPEPTDDVGGDRPLIELSGLEL